MAATAAGVAFARNGPRGGHVVATRDLPAGTLVVHCASLAEGMESLDHCDRCKRWVCEAALCTRCGSFALCARCRAGSGSAAAQDRHSGAECRAFNLLALHLEEQRELPPAVLSTAPPLLKLLIRVGLRLQQHGATDVDFEWHYNSGHDGAAAEVWRSGSLLTHEGHRDAEGIAAVDTTAAWVWKIVQRARGGKKQPAADGGGSGDGGDAKVVSQLATVLHQCNVNVHTILDPSTQRSIGLGLYPSGAMINHNCTPNSEYLPGANGEMRFVTTRRVACGEEITVSYMDIVTSCTAERRAYLAAEYFFRCSCARCEWPSARLSFC